MDHLLPAGYDAWKTTPPEERRGPDCAKCGAQTYGGPSLFTCEDCMHVMEAEPICRRPGRNGCGHCEGCEKWGEDAYDSERMD